MREYFVRVDENDVVLSIQNETADGLVEISRSQAIEISEKLRFNFSKVVVVDDTATLSDNQVGLDAYELEKDLTALHRELEQLEVATARGFLWLVKHLIQEGVIQQANIPAKLIQYKTRIEEIEAELNA